jgi:hypothetical protein
MANGTAPKIAAAVVIKIGRKRSIHPRNIASYELGLSGCTAPQRRGLKTALTIERAYVDKGYRGHDTASPHRVFISGQKRGIFGIIERETTPPLGHRSRHRPHED